MADEELAKIRYAALNYLAMREHSKAELLAKLEVKFGRNEAITCLALLEEQGLQSDSRFAEAFVRMRSRQGKGPQRILMELKQKGIASDIISSNLADQEIWNQLALDVKTKKFGDSTFKDSKEKAKQMRFLASRGFNSVNIHYALTRS